MADLGTTDRDRGEAAAYDPRFDDARDRALKVRRLSDRREYDADYELGVAGIHWESELLPTLWPRQINKLFLLQDANFGEIYWPTSSRWGGHVSLPIRSRTGDATCCVALRTEVRAVQLDTP